LPDSNPRQQGPQASGAPQGPDRRPRPWSRRHGGQAGLSSSNTPCPARGPSATAARLRACGTPPTLPRRGTSGASSPSASCPTRRSRGRRRPPGVGPVERGEPPVAYERCRGLFFVSEVAPGSAAHPHRRPASRPFL